MLAGAVHPSIMQDQENMLRELQSLVHSCADGIESSSHHTHRGQRPAWKIIFLSKWVICSELDRRKILGCANPFCLFRVHPEPSLGGFCCISCYEASLHGTTDHDNRCQQTKAAQWLPRAPAQPPMGAAVPLVSPAAHVPVVVSPAAKPVPVVVSPPVKPAPVPVVVSPAVKRPEAMPQPILAQPPTPVARGSVGRASGLAPRKRPWPMPQILGTVAKATPARPQVPIVSQAVQIQPANIGIPASRWKTQAQEWNAWSSTCNAWEAESFQEFWDGSGTDGTFPENDFFGQELC
eukprot:symbB.v1.2.032024.t1/scaffold3787.1/size50356/3